MTVRFLPACASGLALFLFVESLTAQCGAWNVPAGPVPGIASPLNRVTPWDPDGAGPLPERLVVANTRQIWSHDPVSGIWQELPAPPGAWGFSNLVATPNGTLHCVQRMPNGRDGISWFDGSEWRFLDAGTDGSIKVLSVHSNGELLVGGNFSTIGGTAANHVAWRQGNQWVSFGSSTSSLYLQYNGTVTNITVDGAGDVVVSGHLMSVVDRGVRTPAAVAGFKSNRWVSFAGTPSNITYGFAVQGTTLIGAFMPFGGGAQVARWDGGSGSWVAMGAPFNVGITRMVVDSAGQLVAAGSFTSANGGPADYVARWDGSAWQPLSNAAGPDGYVNDLSRQPGTGDLVAVGGFTHVGEHRAFNVAAFDGNDWGLVGDRINDTVNAVAAADAPGEFFVGGDFTWGANRPIGHVARWAGGGFAGLGEGVDGPVHALLRSSNGDLIVGGDFTTAGGQRAASIARWDGSGWQALGGGVDGAVLALAQLPNGDLIAGGDFTTAGGVLARGLARWDGLQWAAVDPAVDGVTRALLVLPSGEFLVAGHFATIGGATQQGVARWDGNAWTLIGSPFYGSLYGAQCLALLPNGELIAGTTQDVYRLQGGRWVGFAQNGAHLIVDVRALAVLPGGDLIAAGQGWFGHDGSWISNIARWDGTSFARFGVLEDQPALYASALAVTEDGRLAVGSWTGGAVPFLTFYESTCIACTAPRGAPCTSTGGANDFDALDRPWLGATFHARASGLPTQALTAVLTGINPASTPLQAILPSSLTSPAACQLLVAPELFETGVPNHGVLETALPLPDDAALVGAVLHQQVLAFDLGNPAGPTEVTSTRALELTLGVF